jgi:hypothetical protein
MGRTWYRLEHYGMKDLIIGAVDLYSWDKINAWAISIRESGFAGDVVLLAYRVSDTVIENAKKLNITVYKIEHDSFGNAINHTAGGRDTQCHQLRFFHAWQLLSQGDEQYNNVIMTDVRDVIFQSNPSTYLSRYQQLNIKPLILASSEGITFGNEPWNTDNLIRGFGPFLQQASLNWPVYNVGVLAGNAQLMKNLFLSIYQMTYNRYIPSDQSAYNVLLQEGLMVNRFLPTTHRNAWACQCGTMLDPEKAHYQPVLMDPAPIIRDGRVYNYADDLFTIVHQWDRVPELKSAIERRYA